MRHYLSMIFAAVIIAPAVSLSAPIVEESQLEEGVGLEFTVNNAETPTNPVPQEVFAWVIFQSGQRQSWTSNGWGYQTVESSTDWNNPITSDGGVSIPNTPQQEQPLSWSELFEPINSQALNFIENVGLRARGFFLPISTDLSESAINFRFTVDEEQFVIQSFDGDGLPISGESRGGFFALGDNTIESPTAFAGISARGLSNPSAPRQVTTNEFTTSVPVPSSIWLLGAGLIAFGSAARRRRWT